jgi:hypothetical protein
MAAKSKLSRLFTAGNRALLGARHRCDPPQGAAAVGTVSEAFGAVVGGPGITGIEELMTESEAVAAGRGRSCPAMCAYRTQKNVPETGTFVR